MRLTELDPHFLKVVAEDTFRRLDEIAQADGVMFLCPKCFVANNGPIGTHSVICWAPHIPQTRLPNPGRWSLQGTGYEDLTLVAGSSSILLKGGCNAHFWIRDGSICGMT